MKKSFLIILLLTPLLLAQNPGKRLTKYGFEINSKPRIFYDVYTSYHVDSWMSQLNIILNIQNDLLQFTKQGEKYIAKYEVSFTLKHKLLTNPVFSKVWSNEINESNYTKTNSTRLYTTDNKIFDHELKEGEYEIFLNVIDVESGNVFKNSRFMTIKEYSENNINRSMIKLLDEKDSLSSEIQINDYPARIEFDMNQIVYFELETPIPDSIIIYAKLMANRIDQTVVVRDNVYRYYNNAKNFIFTEKIEQDFLEEGKHELVYEIEYNHKKYGINKDFEVVWYNKPIYLYKFDLALRPMRYILSENEQKEIESLSYEEQEIWFYDYWGIRDPTPNTPMNEIQYEYFNRVDEANRMYSQRFKEGWETDRGRALTLYGRPDRLEPHHFATTTKPFEVWFYDSLNQKLTFIDVNKDNNYALVSVEKIGNTENEPNK